MAYTEKDLTSFKEYVKMTQWICDVDSDDQIMTYVKSALSYIKKMTGIQLLVDTITELIDGAGQRQIFLKSSPVISITTLKYNWWTQATPDRITYDTDDYILDKKNWVVIIPAWVYRWFQNIECIYVAWYWFNLIPTDYEDLKAVVALMVKNYMQSVQNAWLKSESVSWTSLVFDKTVVSEEVKELLSPYKNIYV